MNPSESKSYKEFAFRLLVPFKGTPLVDNNPYWAETCFGTFMEKIYLPNSSLFEWIWFTRYQMPLSTDKFIIPAIKGKRNFAQTDKVSKIRYYRCIFFRTSVEAKEISNLKRKVNTFAKKFGYIATNFSVSEPNSYVSDLGSERFAPTAPSMDEAYNKSLKTLRARIVLNYLYTTCTMYFWSLRKYKNGWYAPEINNAPHNATTQSTLESYHHMFCNMTNVPLYVFHKGKNVATSIYPHPDWSPKEKGIKKTRIQF